MGIESEKSARVHKYIASNGELRASCVISTQVVKEICQKHISSPAASLVMGRCMSGALLLSANHKEGHRVGIDMSGDGPLKRVYAEASYEGGVRAYTQNSQADIFVDDNEQTIGDAIGKGTITVETTFPGQQKPYRGTVPLQTGEVGDDIAYYLYQSQQTPSIVSLGVLLDPYGQVVGAGGILIELLPGHSKDTVLELEMRALKAPPLLSGIAAEKPPAALIDTYLAPFELEELEHPHRIKHQCRCSLDRVLKSVKLFPKEDLEQIIEGGEAQPVICEFCKTRYEIPIEIIDQALSSISAN